MISFLYAIGYSLYCNWFKYLPKNNGFEFIYLNNGEIVLKENIQNKNYPTLLIVPGTTGDTENLFFSRLVDYFYQKQFNIIFILNQGQKLNKTQSIPVVNPKFCSSKDTFHIEFALNEIKQKVNGPLFLMGVSFGALYVKNFLSKERNDIKAGMCVASPWCLKKTLKDWRQTKVIKYFYDKSFTSYYKNLLFSNYNVFLDYEKQNKKFKIEKFLDAKDIPELLEICAILDNKTYDKFLKESRVNMKKVKTPLLVIHAKDDPVCHYKNIPLDKIDFPHQIYLSDYGGHMGWINQVDEICLDWCKKFMS
jgi:predicted alpha/beta-fold hydrolase